MLHHPKWNSCSWMLMFISSCLCVFTTYRKHKHADTAFLHCDSLYPDCVAPWWGHWQTANTQRLVRGTGTPSSPSSPAGVKSGPSGPGASLRLSAVTGPALLLLLLLSNGWTHCTAGRQLPVYLLQQNGHIFSVCDDGAVPLQRHEQCFLSVKSAE